MPDETYDPADKFTWKEGDIHFISHGEGPTLAELSRQYEAAEKKAVTSNSTILGAAAEHYVMCQLLRRNMIAALAPAGVPDADIIVSDRVGSTLAAIQV
jgi:hypothetical protein